MKRYYTRSNQWAVGLGLRRSTLYDTHRWMLWCNYGYNTVCLCWSMNPQIPQNNA